LSNPASHGCEGPELFTTSLRLAARGRFARLDDASETVIRRRLETYESETIPVLEFYSEKLTTIDATQVLLKVTNEVTSVILNLGGPSRRDHARENTAPKP
jgi:adenylate kinase family enzyme